MHLREKGITPPDWTNDEQVRVVKLAEVGYACQEIIYTGVDVETSHGMKHFSLTAHDQTELMAQKSELDKAVAGIPSLIDPAVGVPYHADGELCQYWSVEDFAVIAQTAIGYIFYHRTYCNHLNTWIRRTERAEFEAIQYGAELPKDLAANMAGLLGGDKS